MSLPHPAFHLMAKPIGPVCNLSCRYCFYLETAALYPGGEQYRMSDEVLEAYIRQTIAAGPGPRIDFAWQGGEPALLGLDFFRKAVALQAELLPPGWSATNAIQTNGTLLDDDWCRFLKEHGFLVGISLDGPAALHDAYRVDGGGRPTHDRVLSGLRLLQAHRVDFNILCVVHGRNVVAPLEVYRYFKEIGAAWIQFIPLVEPAALRSVPAEAYGRFLIAIIDEWIRHDVGRVFVQMFEECVRVWLGLPAHLCLFRETCGQALILEHDGAVYSCDHFVTPAHRLGEIRQTPLVDIAAGPAQRAFGLAKRDALPRQCLTCDVRFICHGGCPKDRILTSAGGEPGLNYLCAGYGAFFRHADPYLKRIADRLRRRLPAAGIMAEIRQADSVRWKSVLRNDPCPCGSGKKYKVCCRHTFPDSGR